MAFENLCDTSKYGHFYINNFTLCHKPLINTRIVLRERHSPLKKYSRMVLLTFINLDNIFFFFDKS